MLLEITGYYSHFLLVSLSYIISLIIFGDPFYVQKILSPSQLAALLQDVMTDSIFKEFPSQLNGNERHIWSALEVKLIFPPCPIYFPQVFLWETEVLIAWKSLLEAPDGGDDVRRIWPLSCLMCLISSGRMMPLDTAFRKVFFFLSILVR